MRHPLIRVIIFFLPLMFFSCEKNHTPVMPDYIANDQADKADNHLWDKTVSIVWDGTQAAVGGNTDVVQVQSDNGYVTVRTTAENVQFLLSGTGTGQLCVFSTKMFKLTLNNLSLTCNDGPAINSQSNETCFLVIEEGTNTLTDGAHYAEHPEDRKAALFSEGKLCVSGGGSLQITSRSKHAIASDVYIRLCKGTENITLVSETLDGMHANQSVIIDDGTLTINAAGEGIQCERNSVVIKGGKINITSTNDKGIMAEGNIDISGGQIDIVSYAKCIKTRRNLLISGGIITAVCNGTATNDNTPEAIEAKGRITVSDGQVFAQSADDAINSGADMIVSGGYVMAYSTANDGLDANGNLYIKGGVVYAIGAANETAIDANSEEQKKLYIQGGVLVAIGGIERGASMSQNCYQTTSWTKNTWYALCEEGETALVFQTPEKGGNQMVVSTSGTTSLLTDVSTANGSTILNGYVYIGGNISSGSLITLSEYTDAGNGGYHGGNGGIEPPEPPK